MNLLRRIGLFSASAIVLTSVSFSQAWAQFVPRVEVQPGAGNSPAIVLVNGRPAVRFQVSNGGLSPTQRANITADRLRALISARTNWATIGAKVGKNSATVTAGERPICIVTSADAKANKSTQRSLANTWAATLRDLLRMPPLKLAKTDLLIPLGEFRSVDVGGAALGPVTARSADPAVIVSEVEPGYSAVRIYGEAVGDSVVQVMRDGHMEVLTARVRKYAGRFRSDHPLEVTGEPAPGWLLKALTEQFAHKYIESEPGARVEIGAAKLMVDSLERGKSTNVWVPVSITGRDYIPATFNASVSFVNRSVQRKPVAMLFYSNHPESVTKYGQLYMGKLEPDTSARLLYHHQNRLGKRMRFDVSLINPHDVPAKLQVISGVCAPMIDTVGVGFCAGAKFLKDYLNHVGYIVTIPPRSRLVLYSQMLNSIQTASGIVEFRTLEGRDLMVKVAADLPETAGVSRGDVLPISGNDLIAGFSQHAYPSPIKKIDAKYVVGGNWVFIGVGKHPLRDVGDNLQLFGNYGVIYEIKLQIENPTATRQKIDVMFEAGAGLASALFYIDGKFVEKKYVTPPNDFPVAVYHLEPQQTKIVSILTMPLSGSNYPVNVVVRAS